MEVQVKQEALEEENNFQVIVGTGRSHSVGKKKMAYRVIKRIMDILCSMLALVVLFPLFLITAVAIWIEDGGPVIYVQERNGLNGKVFRMYKFRSMCKDAEKLHKDLLKQNEVDGPVFKIKKDPRVTRVGRFIRRTSVDELPQLINILKGEMSVVGPRPLVTYETEKCNAYEKRRMAVKPGLTCYWQCNGRNELSFDEWIKMDLKYIDEASLLVDVKIVLKTAWMVVKGIGAY